MPKEKNTFTVHVTMKETFDGDFTINAVSAKAALAKAKTIVKGGNNDPNLEYIIDQLYSKGSNGPDFKVTSVDEAPYDPIPNIQEKED